MAVYDAVYNDVYYSENPNDNYDATCEHCEKSVDDCTCDICEHCGGLYDDCDCEKSENN